MDGVDNSKLKAMMVIDPEQRTDLEQEAFFNEFKKATFLILLKEDGMVACFEKADDGGCIVPLFTDEEELNKIPKLNNLHRGWIKAEIICELVAKLDKFDEVAINPASENAIGMSAMTFFAIFKDEALAEIEELLKNKGINLPEEVRFYLREEEPNMREKAVNGIYTSEVPFIANFEDSFDEQRKYTNILIVPKGIRFLPVRENEKRFDTIFAPVIKFKLIEENGQTLTWKCISQELNYSTKSNKIIYLIIAIIIIILIITIIKVIL